MAPAPATAAGGPGCSDSSGAASAPQPVAPSIAAVPAPGRTTTTGIAQPTEMTVSAALTASPLTAAALMLPTAGAGAVAAAAAGGQHPVGKVSTQAALLSTLQRTLQRPPYLVSTIPQNFLQQQPQPQPQPQNAHVAAVATATIIASGAASSRSVGKGDKKERSGMWTEEEKEYTERIIYYAEKNLLQVPEGQTLRPYIAKKLNCNPMRVSKKYQVGETRPNTTGADPEALKAASEDLARLEKRFWDMLSQPHESCAVARFSFNDLKSGFRERQASRVHAYQAAQLFGGVLHGHNAGSGSASASASVLPPLPPLPPPPPSSFSLSSDPQRMLALYKQHGLPPRVPAYSLLHDHQARLTTGHSSSLSKKDLKGNSSSGSGSGSSGSSGDSALAGGTPGGPTDAASLFPTVPSAKATKTTTKTTTTSAQQQSPQYSNELEAQLLASLLAPPLPPPVHNTLWPLPTGVSTNLGGRPKEAAAAVSPPLLPLPVSSKQATRVPAVPSSSSSDVAPTPSSGLQPATTTPLCGSAFSHFQPTTVPVPKQATDAPAPSSKADGASTPLSSPSEAAAAAAAMADQPRATHCRPAITLDLFLTPAKPPCTERGEEEQALTQQRPTEIGAMMEGGLPPLPLLSPAEVRAQTVPLPPPIASFLRGEGLPAILSNSDVSSASQATRLAALAPPTPGTTVSAATNGAGRGGKRKGGGAGSKGKAAVPAADSPVPVKRGRGRPKGSGRKGKEAAAAATKNAASAAATAVQQPYLDAMSLLPLPVPLPPGLVGGGEMGGSFDLSSFPHDASFLAGSQHSLVLEDSSTSYGTDGFMPQALAPSCVADWPQTPPSQQPSKPSLQVAPQKQEAYRSQKQSQPAPAAIVTPAWPPPPQGEERAVAAPAASHPAFFSYREGQGSLLLLPELLDSFPPLLDASAPPPASVFTPASALPPPAAVPSPASAFDFASFCSDGLHGAEALLVDAAAATAQQPQQKGKAASSGGGTVLVVGHKRERSAGNGSFALQGEEGFAVLASSSASLQSVEGSAVGVVGGGNGLGLPQSTSFGSMAFVMESTEGMDVGAVAKGLVGVNEEEEGDCPGKRSRV